MPSAVWPSAKVIACMADSQGERSGRSFATPGGKLHGDIDVCMPCWCTVRHHVMVASAKDRARWCAHRPRYVTGPLAWQPLIPLRSLRVLGLACFDPLQIANFSGGARRPGARRPLCCMRSCCQVPDCFVAMLRVAYRAVSFLQTVRLPSVSLTRLQAVERRHRPDCKSIMLLGLMLRGRLPCS